LPTVELVLVLLGVIALLEVIARKARLPLPVLLVAAGVAVALIPGLPRPELAPEAVFLVFVPPLLYVAALDVSPRELRRFFFAIAFLSVGLVLATAVAVAAVAHALIPELTWPAALVLGAIISPPDAVAAIAMLRDLKVPKPIVTVLEGESLTNDATALIAYQASVAAVVTGSFSLRTTGAEFLAAALGGVGIGILLGLGIALIRSRLGRAPTVEATISLLTPFLAYIPAERLGTSGVLAVVTVGLFLSRRAPKVVSAQSRLQTRYMWRMITFLLEGLIFLLVGLRLPLAFEDLGGHTLFELLLYATLVSGAAIALRVVWFFPSSWAARWLRARRERHLPSRPPWQWILFGGLAGIRGGDSLVIALALPLATASGAPFPGRPMIIFLTFVVIVVTLVLLGPLLPLVARRLGLDREAAAAPDEDEHGRARLRAEVPAAPLTLEGVAALRRALIRLWEGGAIGDDVMLKLERELDLAEAMLEARPPDSPPFYALEAKDELSD
jgi:CPA1 family monovalent cation:H+ antiporter